ncbi:hypothetical protein cypCar_00050042 [Cyprinus carpio]|nr:hypothetical protein cypCar_00050042 [Cyprinus carpio]
MFSMCVVLLVFSSISTVVVVSPKKVRGHRGERVDIRCRYESGYESNSKYFCKGKLKKSAKDPTISSFSNTPSYFNTTETNPRSSSITITERKETSTDQHKSAGSEIHICVDD